jgi:hypothetical protein
LSKPKLIKSCRAEEEEEEEEEEEMLVFAILISYYVGYNIRLVVLFGLVFVDTEINRPIIVCFKESFRIQFQYELIV